MKKNIMFLYSFLLCSRLNTDYDLKQTLVFYFNFEELCNIVNIALDRRVSPDK